MPHAYDPPEIKFVFYSLFLSTQTGRTYARYITRQGDWGGALGVSKKED